MSRSDTGSPTWARVMMSVQRRDIGCCRASAGLGGGALRFGGAGRAWATGAGPGALAGASALARGSARQGVRQGASWACAMKAANTAAPPSTLARACLIPEDARHVAADPKGRQGRDGRQKGW